MKRFVLLLLVLLPACDPNYRTEYTLRPPKGEKAQDQANECFSERQVCRSNCSGGLEACHDACEMKYLDCYRQVGGTVTPHKVCIKNCDK